MAGHLDTRKTLNRTSQVFKAGNEKCGGKCENDLLQVVTIDHSPSELSSNTARTTPQLLPLARVKVALSVNIDCVIKLKLF